MKDTILIALCCCLGVVAWSGSATNAIGQQKKFDDLYDQWHKTLEANPASGEPLWISTPEMKQAGIAFAIYLCEKVADKSNAGFRLYQDVILLIQVAGVATSSGQDDKAYFHLPCSP